MADEPRPFHIVRLTLSVPRLITMGRRRGLPMRSDEGYLVHCALGELFGELAPRPFAIDRERGRYLDVLAYSGHDAPTLRLRADAVADPEVHAVCDWSRLAAKPMPAEWPTGLRLGFAVRLCPVVRAGKATSSYRKGAEVDVYLARLNGGAAPANREQVYRDWLLEQIERRGGARIVGVALTAFRRERLVRRTHGVNRVASVRERPVGQFEGELEVMDGREFAGLLSRGIGRHRAFGFGMLLLRPPRA